jgi:hypothetical protein
MEVRKSRAPATTQEIAAAVVLRLDGQPHRGAARLGAGPQIVASPAEVQVVLSRLEELQDAGEVKGLQNSDWRELHWWTTEDWKTKGERPRALPPEPDHYPAPAKPAEPVAEPPRGAMAAAIMEAWRESHRPFDGPQA